MEQNATAPVAAAAAQAPRTRVSIFRVLVVVACVAAVGWFGTRSVSALVAGSATPGPSTFAAYVDVTATPTYPFETPNGPAQSTVVLSFIVAGHDDPCTPTWGGYYTPEQAASELELDRRISQLRLTGGEVRVSFGGQLNTELASACSDPQALREAYASVIDRYDVSVIDLDLEGVTLDDTAGMTRRAAAIKDLQDEAASAGTDLLVWLTLPVSPEGLTEAGRAAVAAMLSAGVDVTGVNGMTMDFGVVSSEESPLSGTVIAASNALHQQVGTAFANAGRSLTEAEAWSRVGITPMIGQNDVVTERFTLDDAERVNTFAREQGVGLVAMWSLNRDATCVSPLPSVLTVVQTSCSGIDQQGLSFAETLSSGLDLLPSTVQSPTSTPSPTATQSTRPDDIVDDPETSPYPIWDPLGTYPAGTKAVWRQQVYEARYWTSGIAPDTPVANPLDSPWTLIGPVLPGDTPAPLPTFPAGTYPEWDTEAVYVAGNRVQLDLVAYEAKWWTQGQRPGEPVAGGSPWVMIYPNE